MGVIRFQEQGNGVCVVSMISEKLYFDVCKYGNLIENLALVGPKAYSADGVDTIEDCCIACAKTEECVAMSFDNLSSECVIYLSEVYYGVNKAWTQTFVNENFSNISRVAAMETTWWNILQTQKRIVSPGQFLIESHESGTTKKRKDYDNKVRSELLDTGMVPSTGIEWDFLWGIQWQEIHQFERAQLATWQLINMIPGTAKLVLGEKDALHHLYDDASPEIQTILSECMLRSFVVPNIDQTLLPRSPAWILKELDSWSGRGVQVMETNSLISSLPAIGHKPAILQKYVLNPITLGGHKFDTRWWVTITSVSPLRVYMIPTGYVRQAVARYSSDPSHFSDKCMHVTNGNVQVKCNKHQLENTIPSVTCTSCSGFVSSLRDSRNEKLKDPVAFAYNLLMKTQLAVIKAILASLPGLQRYRNATSARCFQFLAFDIVYDDETLSPWIEEINTNGYIAGGISKTASTARNIKGNSPDFVKELFSLVGANGYNRSSYQDSLQAKLTSHFPYDTGFYRDIQETVDEIQHAGNWEMIYPFSQVAQNQKVKLMASIYDQSKFSPVAYSHRAIGALLKAIGSQE